MKYKFNGVEVVDKESGEIIDISELKNELSKLSEKEIVDRYVVLKEIYSIVNEYYRVLELKFINNMEQKDATKYEDEDFVINLSKQYDYKYNASTIEKIKRFVGKEKFDQTFEKQYKVNRTMLKSLSTMGGKIKQLIFDMESCITRKPYVTIKNKTSINK